MLFYIDFTALLISNRKTKLNLKHNISPSPFVCPLVDHRDVFGAIVVLTQLAIQNGEPLFPVEYND